MERTQSAYDEEARLRLIDMKGVESGYSVFLHLFKPDEKSLMSRETNLSVVAYLKLTNVALQCGVVDPSGRKSSQFSKMQPNMARATGKHTAFPTA